MLRCRIPAILLILALPLQSIGRGSCCQSGAECCCSRSAADSRTRAASCCSSRNAPAKTHGCQHCAEAKKKDEPVLASAGRCRCQCRKAPKERPTQLRRQLSSMPVLGTYDALFVPSISPVRTRLQVEVTDRSPGLRLHAIHSVWLC